MAPVLIDTNVLVYAYDRGESVKQGQAIYVLDSVQSTGAGCISVQSLAEFFRATTKGARPILSVEQAMHQARELALTWQVLILTPQIVLEAARGVHEHQFSYWDAQIWAAARFNQVPLVLSEDFANGAIVEGVRFVNPFVPTFDIRTLLEEIQRS